MLARLSSFLSKNASALLYGATTGILGWLATHAVVQPILRIREKRIEALQLAERHAHARGMATEQNVRSCRSAIGDVAAGMRALARAQPAAARFYCWCLGYNLEMAVGCSNGLMQMIGNESYGEENRRNNLDGLYDCLRADKHIPKPHRKEIRNMLREAGRSN